MTIPAKPDYFLVQNVFHGATGLPHDVFVNSFIFRNTQQPSVESAEGRAMDCVKDFYSTVKSGSLDATASVNHIIGLMASYVTRWTQKCYDLGNPPGDRVPIEREYTGTDFPARGSSGTPLPAELSVVLSLQTAYTGPWGRGRLYMGPFNTISADVPANYGGVSVTKATRDRLALQAGWLALGNGRDMEWCVYSGAKNRMQRVTGGWVDDAWDVQRRRGHEPTMRQNWGTIVPSHSGTTGEAL